MKYLQKRFSVPAAGPGVTDADWNQIFGHPPKPSYRGCQMGHTVWDDPNGDMSVMGEAGAFWLWTGVSWIRGEPWIAAARRTVDECRRIEENAQART